MSTTNIGIVLEREGATYRVLTPAGECRAILRGKVKRDAERIVVGDKVRLEPEPAGDVYAVTGVEPRTSLLERRVPEGRGARPVAANIDEVFVVTAVQDPPPLLQLIDRLLVLAVANDLAAAVVINKTDLADPAPLTTRFERAGYRTFATSVKTGDGIAEFAEVLHTHTALVTGPSGAGKSSLLNAVEPGLKLRTGAISERVRRGKNTTVSAVMIPLELGGYLVDTPGFSDVGLWGIDPRELAACFPEMVPLIGECKFGDCRHVSEPGCAITGAVECGDIAADRLESYRILLAEVEGEPMAWE